VTERSPGFIATDFAQSVTNPAIRDAIARRAREIRIPPEAIARPQTPSS
jgi:hypothetical protein